MMSREELTTVLQSSLQQYFFTLKVIKDFHSIEPKLLISFPSSLAGPSNNHASRTAMCEKGKKSTGGAPRIL
jgi:hypothetical protein